MSLVPQAMLMFPVLGSSMQLSQLEGLWAIELEKSQYGTCPQQRRVTQMEPLLRLMIRRGLQNINLRMELL